VHLVTWSELLGRPVRCQELDLMILKGPFQLRIFYDSMILNTRQHVRHRGSLKEMS